MELTTRGRYAVMSMAELARHTGSEALALSAVAERQRLSLDYLEQIFAKLRRADLVQSTRGRTGGYRLSRPAAEINIAEIMVAVEEETRMTRCLSNDQGGCLGEERCLTHNLWKALGEHIVAFLRSISLKDVLEGNAILQPSPAGQHAAAHGHSNQMQAEEAPKA